MASNPFHEINLSACGYPNVGLVKTPFCFDKLETTFRGHTVSQKRVDELFNDELRKANNSVIKTFPRKDKRRSINPPFSLLDQPCRCKKQGNEPKCGGTFCNRFFRHVECPQNCSKDCRNSMFDGQQMVNPQVSIKYLPVKEWCLFAEQDIPARSFVFEFRGEIISEEALEKDPISLRYAMKLFNSNLYVDPSKKGNVERFIAHSCAANCKSFTYLCQDRSVKCVLFTENGIKKGSEITFNYNMGKHKNMTCYCGSRKCPDIGQYLAFLESVAFGKADYSKITNEELMQMKLSTNSVLASKSWEEHINSETFQHSSGMDIDGVPNMSNPPSDAETEVVFAVEENIPFTKSEKLLREMKRKSGIRTKSLEFLEMSNNFVCATCGMRFAEQKYLQKHIVRHKAPKKQCPFPDCLKPVSYASFTRHVKNHSNQTKFSCENRGCTKKYGRRDNLRHHMSKCKLV